MRISDWSSDVCSSDLEYWTAVGWLNELGTAGQAGLISPGLGFDHFLDLRLDAIDAAAGVDNKTQRTIEGPLYVAGAPVEQGHARLDDGRDTDGQLLVMHGTVYRADGKPAPDRKSTRLNSSH